MGMSTRPQWTILKLLGWTTDYFSGRDIDSPRATAEILLAHSLGLRRIDLYVQYDRPMAEDELRRFKGLIRRRAAREPVAYIVGEKEFWSMPLTVTSAVLVPRPETECLVEAVLDRLPELQKGSTPAAGLRVLELGTGSGAVIISLAKERPGYSYTATDRRHEIVALARSNAEKNGLGSAVRFVVGDWFQPFSPAGDRFDLIVSNPPYIPTGVIPGLQPEVSRFEPAGALDGGPDGLACLAHIIRTAPGFLKSGGCLAVEMGHDQRSAVEKIVLECGEYSSVEFFTDYSGYDRGGVFVRR